MWIEREGIKEEVSYTEEEFLNTSLPLKGWIISTAPVVPPLTSEQLIHAMIAELERYYDSVAQAKHYDNRYTCMMRAGFVGPFQAEGLAFAVWMDGCNAYGYQVIADCINGTRNIPTFEELKLELPVAPW